jgi:hypothetical protein
VLLATLGGVGHLYAYDVANRKWSLLGDLGNRDLAGLAYDAKNDLAVGFHGGHPGAGVNRMVAINAKGAVVKETVFERRLDSGGSGLPHNSILAHVEAGHVFVVTPPMPGDEDATGRLTVLDQDTGRAVLSVRQRLQKAAEKIELRANDIDALRAEKRRLEEEIQRLRGDADAVLDRIDALDRARSSPGGKVRATEP